MLKYFTFSLLIRKEIFRKVIMQKNILDEIANNSIYGKGLGLITTEYCGNIFRKYMIGKSVLELGPADGVMTNQLFNDWNEDYTAVDGSNIFIENLKKKHIGIKTENYFFEEYMPNRKFDNIILGHVLEHVDDPTLVLKLCASWLNVGGVLLAAVPNSNSLHRQAAVLMGILSSVNSFSEKDKRHGHKRVFNFDSFNKLFIESELHIIESGGYWLKPLSDGQIESSWTKEMINAYLKLGELYPKIAGEIYIIAKLKECE